MTNAEMLRRIEKLSTSELKRNVKAAEKTVGHWEKLAAGELDAKPSCPFCSVSRFGCETCALQIVSSDNMCGTIYWNWDDARVTAENRRSRRLCGPLRSRHVRAAAKKMLAHVRRVGRLIGKALEGRVK